MRPEQARGVYTGQGTLREGALAFTREAIRPGGGSYDQGAIIWTANTVVNVQASGLPQGAIGALLNDLAKLNHGGGNPGDPMLAPDFSAC